MFLGWWGVDFERSGEKKCSACDAVQYVDFDDKKVLKEMAMTM